MGVQQDRIRGHNGRTVKRKVPTFVDSTLGPVKVLLLQRFFSSFRTSACRCRTQFWTPARPEPWARSTKAEVQSFDARPHKNRCRESVKTVLWSDLVVQRVFRPTLMENTNQILCLCCESDGNCVNCEFILNFLSLLSLFHTHFNRRQQMHILFIGAKLLNRNSLQQGAPTPGQGTGDGP